MSGHTAAAGGDLRARILRDPELVLNDPAVMRALVTRDGGAGGHGGKVIDLRAVAMARLEARLDRLEAAHRTVIAAAYENLAGTQQIHRAALRLLDADSAEGFLDALGGEVAAILRLDAVRLVLECEEPIETHPRAGEAVLRLVPPGAVAWRLGSHSGPGARVTLRRGASVLALGGAPEETPSGPVASEAWLGLDLGPGRLPALLALGSCDADEFAPGQGTELLEFLAGVCERALRRWLG